MAINMEKNAIKIGFPEFPVTAAFHVRPEPCYSRLIITNSAPSGSILFMKVPFPASTWHQEWPRRAIKEWTWLRKMLEGP